MRKGLHRPLSMNTSTATAATYKKNHILLLSFGYYLQFSKTPEATKCFFLFKHTSFYFKCSYLSLKWLYLVVLNVVTYSIISWHYPIWFFCAVWEYFHRNISKWSPLFCSYVSPTQTCARPHSLDVFPLIFSSFLMAPGGDEGREKRLNELGARTQVWLSSLQRRKRRKWGYMWV